MQNSLHIKQTSKPQIGEIVETISYHIGKAGYFGKPFIVDFADQQKNLFFHYEIRKGDDWMTIQEESSQNPGLIRTFSLSKKRGKWKYDDPYIIKFKESSYDKLLNAYENLKIAIGNEGFIQSSEKATVSERSSKVAELTEGFVLDIHNVLMHTEDPRGNDFFAIELGSLVTESIMNELDSVREKGVDQSLWLAGNPNMIIGDPEGNKDEIFRKYEKKIDNFCKVATSRGRTPIIGLSLIGDYRALSQFSKIIKKMKDRHESLVVIIGGSDFRKIPSEEFVRKIFYYGIDIINIGGAAEFVDFFGKLKKNDVFYRDEEGCLRIRTEREIPKNLIFEHQKHDIPEMLTPGEDISTTSYHSRLHNILYFSIKNSHCMNRCRYCAPYLQKHSHFKEEDLMASIDDCNNYLAAVKDENIVLHLDNPNPMQHIDRFVRFMLGIDLSKVSIINFFGDFLGMVDPAVYEKMTGLMDELIRKWPDLILIIRFGIDALKAEGDGEFIGRTHGTQIVKEEKYEAAFSRLKEFHDRYAKEKRIESIFNLIFHPNMKIEDYMARIDFANRYKKIPMTISPLTAYFNTDIEKEHKGFYIPEYETADVDLLDLNTWGHFYLSSRYLDCYIFLRNTGHQYMFPAFVGFMKIIEDENKDDNIFLYFLAWHYSNITDAIGEYNSTRFLFEKKQERQKKRSEIRLEIERLIDSGMKYLDFMIRREGYIKTINPLYDHPDFKKFMNNLEEHKAAFSELREELNTDVFGSRMDFFLYFSRRLIRRNKKV